MELLLNLLWLLLALPAVWIWREARHAQSRIDSRRSLLLLACIVILLFPIVSASDDLQAMRPEVEESVSRDALRQDQGCCHAAQCDHSGCGLALHLPPVILPGLASCGHVVALQVVSPVGVLVVAEAGRAPPPALLS